MAKGNFSISSVNIPLLAGSVILSYLAGFIGSLFTETGTGSWYQTVLVKPWFTPPGIVFPVVWNILYLLMGISLYLLLSGNLADRRVRILTGVFGIQLVLNALWSILFFGLKSPVSGLICIIILWSAILYLIVYSWNFNRKVSYLLIPYIVWVTIATAINAAVVILNPGLL
ncbi:TspO/MBR family protein [Methanoplanus limicola]|uniref:TspO and MBR like protein n=1 Tax=Methanoplanus limicola DSM 2279 TaxID=937775 RepID=H1YXM1_9EURY|nr:TspO/MBR family protein [Methanoplanus limicola]EHQ34990.1 TspO and MBR like protein [Methanoplanus limicola DSM 2279]